MRLRLLPRLKAPQPSAEAGAAIQDAPAERMSRQVYYVGTATADILIEDGLNLVFTTGTLPADAVLPFEIFIRRIGALRKYLQQFRVPNSRAMTHERAVNIGRYLPYFQPIRFEVNISDQ